MIKETFKSMIRKIQCDWTRAERYTAGGFPVDFEGRHKEIIKKVRTYTLTSYARIFALVESVRHVLKNCIPGALVECGVYRGGSMMAVALALLEEGVTDRELYLFDTYEGMPAPDERDMDVWGRPTERTFSKRKISSTSSKWTNASLASVQKAMATTGYPAQRIHYIKGMVEDTIPSQAPHAVALLRLDTDWYKSTMHELAYLYPRLSRKGVLIIDDYGHYRGARQAADEYFHKNNMAPFLHRIDYTGRLIIKE